MVDGVLQRKLDEIEPDAFAGVALEQKDVQAAALAVCCVCVCCFVVTEGRTPRF